MVGGCGLGGVCVTIEKILSIHIKGHQRRTGRRLRGKGGGGGGG